VVDQIGDNDENGDQDLPILSGSIRMFTFFYLPTVLHKKKRMPNTLDINQTKL